MFTYIYVNTFVSSFSSSVSVESLVSLARYLSAADKARLVAALAKI
jgi:hypothetical protein